MWLRMAEAAAWGDVAVDMVGWVGVLPWRFCSVRLFRSAQVEVWVYFIRVIRDSSVLLWWRRLRERGGRWAVVEMGEVVRRSSDNLGASRLCSEVTFSLARAPKVLSATPVLLPYTNFALARFTHDWELYRQLACSWVLDCYNGFLRGNIR